MAESPEPFTWVERADGRVDILRGGAVVTTLRSGAATRFLAQVASGDAQRLMARVTGNYRRGNERDAGEHPRNRPA